MDVSLGRDGMEELQGGNEEGRTHVFDPAAGLETVIGLGVEVAPLGWGEGAKHPSESLVSLGVRSRREG